MPRPHFTRGLLALFSGSVLGALFWRFLGPRISASLAGKVGPALIAFGHGKVTDVAAFIYGRTWELLVALGTGALLVLAVVLLHRLLSRWSAYRLAEGVGQGVLSFLALNVWLTCARQTAFFWLFLFNPRSIDNFTQFQIKKHLLNEQTAHVRMVLLGNSQTRAAIREETLNDLLGPTVWTTELHQPGCNGFDTYLVVDDLQAEPFQVGVIYVSEIFFYGRENGGVFPSFLELKNLTLLRSLGGMRQIESGTLRDGIAGALLPLYRLNPTLSQRVLGGFVSGLAQQQFNDIRAADEVDPNAQLGSNFRTGESAEFQKRGMEEAIRALAASRRRLIIIAGSVNPKLRDGENPAVLADLNSWLDAVARRWPGTVSVVRESEFFEPVVGDFDDFVHYNEPAQLRFSEALAAHLQKTGILNR